MIDVGISDIAIYVPALYLEHKELAEARGIPPDKLLIGLGNRRMSIIPEWEDAVTMAANAAAQLLEKSGTAPEEIGQLVVSTESGVDHSKPVSSFVQGLLGIGPRCRIYEIKHACYGGTAGVVNTIDWIYRNGAANRKALVITTDIARYGFESAGEPTQGAGAIAMLMEKNPRLLSVDTSLNGIFSCDVYDFWRPNGHGVPIVDGKYSISCYLRALEAAVADFRSNLGIHQGKLLEYFDYIVYHMPFTSMARKAHRQLIEIEYGGLPEEDQRRLFTETFKTKVCPGLLGVAEVGNIYTGSVYMGVVSLLETEKEKAEGKRVGVFSYGSGCGAEFFLCHIKKGIGSLLKQLRFREQLARRKKISVKEYVEIYSRPTRETRHLPHEVTSFKDAFTRFVFTGIKDHKRQYA